MPDTVTVTRDGARATVVMHRNGNNSIGLDLLEDLEAAFDEVAQDDSVRVVVLASEYEKYFSVGADLMSLGGSIDRSAADAEERYADTGMRLNSAYLKVESCPKPVIARINGHALGAAASSRSAATTG